MTIEESRIVIECIITNIVGEFGNREIPKGVQHIKEALEIAEEIIDKYMEWGELNEKY